MRRRWQDGLDLIDAAIKAAPAECVEWPFARSGSGYGVIRLPGQSPQLAHRLALERQVGPPPEPGMVAAHEPLVCHNSICVNAHHLRWATQSENLADMAKDGTHGQGENHARARLSSADVVDIRADNRSNKVLAEEYGVTSVHIGRIRRGTARKAG